MVLDFTSNLVHARQLIASLYHSVRSLDTSRLIFHSPIIDRLNMDGWVSDEVGGLKRFKEAVEHASAHFDTVRLKALFLQLKLISRG